MRKALDPNNINTINTNDDDIDNFNEISWERIGIASINDYQNTN